MQTDGKKGEANAKVPVWPCILIILFLPVIILIFIGSLLFVPVDYLIFKRSLYHKTFGGKYSFLSGAHPDNRLYTLIKKEKLPILYAKENCSYNSQGFFFCKRTLITAHEHTFYDKNMKELMCRDAKINRNAVQDKAAFTVDEMTERLLDEFSNAVHSMKCDNVVFLIKYSRAKKLLGKDGISIAEKDDRFVIYERKNLKEKLAAIAERA